MAGAAETHLEDQLSRDVDALGRLLGEVLREQEGEDGFALVEEYRARTKALHDPRRPPSERSRLHERIREEITALWLTDEVRRRAPTVLDEVRNGLYYFEQSLWHVVPRLYRELEASLAAAYPGQSLTVPPFLRFGSWVGGDRDGNPSVTADVTEATLRLHKETALA